MQTHQEEEKVVESENEDTSFNAKSDEAVGDVASDIKPKSEEKDERAEKQERDEDE